MKSENNNNKQNFEKLIKDSMQKINNIKENLEKSIQELKTKINKNKPPEKEFLENFNFIQQKIDLDIQNLASEPSNLKNILLSSINEIKSLEYLCSTLKQNQDDFGLILLDLDNEN